MSDLSQQALNPLTASASELRAAFADSRELDQIFGEKRTEAARNIKLALIGITPTYVEKAYKHDVISAKQVRRCSDAWNNGRAYLEETYTGMNQNGLMKRKTLKAVS